MLDRWFQLRAHGTSVRTELLAGVTTFLTMAYIIFVQPAVLSGQMLGTSTGMDFGAVTTATCVSAAVATLVMGLVAGYPVGLASGMGQNFFFAATVLPAIGQVVAERGWDTEPWRVGLGVVFVAGVLFLLLTCLGVREAVMHAISPSMKNAIAVGIGLFIAFVGLQNAGLIVDSAGTLVQLNTRFGSPDLLVFFAGLVIVAVLHARGVPGALLVGILATTGASAAAKLAIPHLGGLAKVDLVASSDLMNRFELADGVVAPPPDVRPTAFALDLFHALLPAMIPYIVIFLFMDVFDTMGTLIGIGEQAGLVRNNRLPRAGRAMLADAVGTVTGAALGTTTVTSYVESAAGVEQGGRTGLTAVVVAAGFLLALAFAPVIEMVGSYPAIVAPALVLVGAMMARNVVRVDWADATEALPAFLTMAAVPLTFNIGDGLALGLIAYPIVKGLTGRAREVPWLMYPLAVALVCYFVFARAPVGG